MKFKPNEIDGWSLVYTAETSDGIAIIANLHVQQAGLLETIEQLPERIGKLEAVHSEKCETTAELHKRIAEFELYRASNEWDWAEIKQDD